MTTQTPSTIPSEYYKNHEILKSMQKKMPRAYYSDGAEEHGKDRVNIEIALINKLKVRREVDIHWVLDVYGLTVWACVLGASLPIEPHDLKMDIQHHIEELYLNTVRNLIIEL